MHNTQSRSSLVELTIALTVPLAFFIITLYVPRANGWLTLRLVAASVLSIKIHPFRFGCLYIVARTYRLQLNPITYMLNVVTLRCQVVCSNFEIELYDFDNCKNTNVDETVVSTVYKNHMHVCGNGFKNAVYSHKVFNTVFIN